MKRVEYLSKECSSIDKEILNNISKQSKSKNFPLINLEYLMTYFENQKKVRPSFAAHKKDLNENTILYLQRVVKPINPNIITKIKAYEEISISGGNDGVVSFFYT